MYISSNSIVSNSDMIKNYKKCREKAEGIGKVFVLKFNAPDAVLFSFREFEKLEKSLKESKRKEDKRIAQDNDDLPTSDEIIQTEDTE